MKNTLINREATLRVANALGELNEEVVFVGGAVVSFYIDDPAADDVRPTKDIDIVLEIASLIELEEVRTKLTKKGFYQSSEDDVICRFRYKETKVDVMSTKEIGWAPANPWFEKGYNDLIQVNIGQTQINCLSLPYYLATKFAAYYGRGGNDPRTSHDFEDIVYLLNFNSNFVEQIKDSNYVVKQYLIKCFKDILSDSVKQEAIFGNLFYEDQEYRFSIIIDKLTLVTYENSNSE